MTWKLPESKKWSEVHNYCWKAKMDTTHTASWRKNVGGKQHSLEKHQRLKVMTLVYHDIDSSKE